MLAFSCISRYLFTQNIWIVHGQENEEQPCNGCIHAGQAYRREHPDKGLIVHTGQDSQFTSGNFQTLLCTHEAMSSVSRKGNALMESFYRTIKRELIQDANFEASEQAQQEIFKYIELYYNTKRMHSSLGYLSLT